MRLCQLLATPTQSTPRVSSAMRRHGKPLSGGGERRSGRAEPGSQQEADDDRALIQKAPRQKPYCAKVPPTGGTDQRGDAPGAGDQAEDAFAQPLG